MPSNCAGLIFGDLFHCGAERHVDPVIKLFFKQFTRLLHPTNLEPNQCQYGQGGGGNQPCDMIYFH